MELHRSSLNNSVVSPKGGAITVTPEGTTCVLTVGEEGNKTLKKFTAENVGTTGVKVSGEAEGITYTATSGCGIATKGTEGKYKGSVEGSGVIIR